MPTMPSFIIVGGVCGSGKSSVGEALARRLECDFVDADDYHSVENKRKMAAGIALNDEDRWPWLNRLAQLASTHPRLVIGCSALKRKYREFLVERSGKDPNDCRIFMLRVPRQLLALRLNNRVGHFFNSDLLDSQLATLELPAGNSHDEDDAKNEQEFYLRIVEVANNMVDEVVGEILRELKGY